MFVLSFADLSTLAVRPDHCIRAMRADLGVTVYSSIVFDRPTERLGDRKHRQTSQHR
jgi:hypothetical protein